MSETAPDGTVSLAPLPADALPSAVLQLVGGPVPAKMMALKGIAPLKAPELLTAIYQLSFDADAGVRAAADAAPRALPDRVLTAPLGEPLPAPVLHFFALRLEPARVQPLAKILYNGATADGTFIALAGRLRESELEIVVQNELRLLRSPGIVAALFRNREARMSSVNRAIELCARNGVRVEGIPAFEEIAKSIAADPAASTPAADTALAGLLDEEENEKAEDDEPVEAVAEAIIVEDDEDQREPLEAIALPGAKPAPAPEAPRPRKSLVVDFAKLKLHEKIRLATLGNASCRAHLITDSNRLVAMAAITSPAITDTEVVRAAASRAVSEDVIRYIASSREYLKLYPVRLNLVQNPKTPLSFSLRLLPVLHADDLKALTRSKNVPSALTEAARRLTQTRGKS